MQAKRPINKQSSQQRLITVSKQLQTFQVSLLIGGYILLSLAGGSHLIEAAGSSTPNGANSNGEQASSSSQALLSYQTLKPNGFYSNPISPSSSFFETLTSGLSQRQGALSNSPIMSILPIILIAAGGILLLLPFLTMMLASPFGGPGVAGLYGYQNGQFGGGAYPQAAKKRSLINILESQYQQPKMWQELLDNVSSTINELTRKYQTQNPPGKVPTV